MVARARSASERGWLPQGLLRSSMLGKTLRPGDEELGKKDDDGKYMPARRPPWTPTFRWRRRRNILLVAGLVLLFMLLRSSASGRDDADALESPLDKPNYASTTYTRPTYEDDEPTGAPPGVQKPRHGDATPHTYGGQVRFFRLARTLRSAASHTNGYERRNRNVLFVVSSLKSASTLVPMICDMSTGNRNYVHAAFMGREDIALEDLLEINGVDKEKCPAVWHDARPDYSEYVY